MIRAFLSERVKLRRRWFLVGTYGSIALFSIASTIFQIVLADRAGSETGAGLKSPEILSSTQGLSMVITDSAAFTGVVVVILFATAWGTEYGWGTLRNLLIRQPDRTKLFSGKMLGLIDFVYTAIVVATVGSVIAAAILAPGQDIGTERWFTADGVSAVVHSTVNLMMSVLGWASLGTLAAVLLRSPGPAVGVILAIFPIEGLVTGLWDDGPRWLPGQVFAAVARGGNLDTSYDRALALTLGYGLIGLCLALILMANRDVTS